MPERVDHFVHMWNKTGDLKYIRGIMAFAHLGEHSVHWRLGHLAEKKVEAGPEGINLNVVLEDKIKESGSCMGRWLVVVDRFIKDFIAEAGSTEAIEFWEEVRDKDSS